MKNATRALLRASQGHQVGVLIYTGETEGILEHGRFGRRGKWRLWGLLLNGRSAAALGMGDEGEAGGLVVVSSGATTHNLTIVDGQPWGGSWGRVLRADRSGSGSWR